MTFQEELNAIANLQLELALLQVALVQREHAEKDVTNRDPDNLRYAIGRYRSRWAEVRHAFDVLSRD